jgi:hypothetical protein
MSKNMSKKNKIEKPSYEGVMSPKLEVKKPTIRYRYYCEACSHWTEIGEDHKIDKLPVRCGVCQKVNKFESKNILPL